MVSATHHAYLALGSNLDDPLLQVHTAIQEIADIPGITVLQTSSFYQNPAIGPGLQNDYINAVVKVETAIPPLELLDRLQALEHAHGRRRNIRWEPRPLDLDILLYGNLISDSERLTLPHPEMCKRNFVIFPLVEIAPDLILPDRQSVEQVAKQLDSSELTIVNANS